MMTRSKRRGETDLAECRDVTLVSVLLHTDRHLKSNATESPGNKF